MKFLLIAAACLLCIPTFASTTSVTATLTDSDGTVWANCTWQAVVKSQYPPTIAGVAVPESSLRANGSCSSAGLLSATMLDTSSIQQSGATWSFIIQPNASVAPSTVQGVAVTGTSIDLSSSLSAGLTKPRFDAGPGAYGYSDIEVRSSTSGSAYFNTGTVCGSPSFRQLSNAGWQCGSSSSAAATDSTLGTVKLASGQTATTLAKVASTGLNGDLTGTPANPGVTVFGDSISCGTGTTVWYKGYAFLLHDLVGGTYTNYCRSGDYEADQNINAIFTATTPVGGGKDPVYVSALGTNDSVGYGTTKPLIYRRLRLGSLSWLGIPDANKVYAQGRTTTGTCAADNTIRNLQGESCSTSGATISFPVTTTVANQVVYLWYVIADSGTGTFTISLDGTAQTDPLTSSTSISNAGDGGTIATTNGATYGVAGFRIPVATAGSHTILVTLTTAAAVKFIGVGVAPAAVSTDNPTVVALGINHQNSTNDTVSGTYDGYVQTIVSTLAGDQINAIYADTRTALGTNYSTYYTDSLHPNDAGHLLMSTTVEGVIPARFLNANNITNNGQKVTEFGTTDATNPAEYWNPNENRVVSHGWGRGIAWWRQYGQLNFTGYLANTGVTTGFPNLGSNPEWCVYAYTATNGFNGVSAPPASTDCYLALTGNGVFTVRAQPTFTTKITQTITSGNATGFTMSHNASEGSGTSAFFAANIYTSGVSAYGVKSTDSKEYQWGVGNPLETGWSVAGKWFVRDVTNSANIWTYDPTTTTHTFNGQITAPINGQATAPSGTCTVTGQWVFSQDGHATFCDGSTWTTKI